MLGGLRAEDFPLQMQRAVISSTLHITRSFRSVLNNNTIIIIIVIIVIMIIIMIIL